MSAVVVVESPAKAKTIEKYLGKGYKVLASYGHVRALPRRDGSVDPEHDFAVTYEILADKQKRLDAIDKALKKADTLILATDLDREGEAIAWHVTEVLRQRGTLDGKKIQRITFHEITEKAIKEAIAHPGAVNMKLVDAQQARSALDYLVGFTLSPLLWRKVRSGLSAGRVQSVALRLICEREEHIRTFKPREYWTIEADCGIDGASFSAKLYAIDGAKLGKFAIKDGAQAKLLARKVESAAFTVVDVEKRQTKQQPPPPFITTTLQMEAARKLGFTARKTMQIAQRLYEGVEVNGDPVGLITYMRTDSVALADEAIAEMREYIGAHFGDDYLPARPRRFKTKSKNAQEAHEAIRPTSISRTPESMRGVLDADAWRLYELIWKRALASQMASAVLDRMRVDIEATCDEQMLTLRANGSALAFAGFRALYVEGTDDAKGEDENNKMLPPLTAGDTIMIARAEARQHFTEPKPRYTEATLVKELEANGIGRPSTYATILNVLRERNYVKMEKKRFVPTELGEWVNRFLVQSFSDIVDTNFTASVEDKLDAIARGEIGWKPVLREFWAAFKPEVDKATKAERPVEETDETCPECGKPMVVKFGRYGKFLACTGYPQCKLTKPLNNDHEAAEPQQTDQVCAKCGAPMVIKSGRFGRFLACSAYPKCKNTQPLEKPKDTGVRCPECGEGTFLEKKSRRGKVFYSCSRYPKCKNALWDRPIERPCPQCQGVVVEKRTKRNGVEHICTNKDCGWKEQVEPAEVA